MDSRAVVLHQVHLAKLTTDGTAEVVSTVLLWQRRPVLGMTARLLPPILASAILLRRDLEPLAHTACGRYVLAHMPPAAQATRLAGDVLTAWGAWRHSIPTMLLGYAVIAAGWSFGAIPPTPGR